MSADNSARIFLDANILFSAAKTDGAIRRLLQLLITRGHSLWVDAFVLEEARRNLAVKSVVGLHELERHSHLWCEGKTTPVTLEYKKVDLPEKDLPALAAAVGNHCDILVTGDKTHFGILYGRVVLGVTIHSPQSLAAALLT